jgi:predicted nucleic acid-binding protein
MLVVDTNILVYAADAGHRRATWLSGNLIHGMHTAVLMREHGVARICTRDADFRRFSFL